LSLKPAFKIRTALNDLLPYIYYCELKNIYTAYVPYLSFDINIQNIAYSTYLICKLLDLSNNNEDYTPSYTYCYNDTKFEIGIKGNNLDKIYESIKIIQLKLKNHNCIINDNLSTLEIRKNNIICIK